MVVVNKKQVDLIDGKLVTEASDLELKPGEWPDFISVVDDNNVGFLFTKSRRIDNHGEFGGYTYYDRTSGVTLEVFND